ncbi:MAG: DUF6298 domain-containing protein [Terracidiphilus sp.]|nr:DUF6298 domain-containing protein [Terracidiphilus sp.]
MSPSPVSIDFSCAGYEGGGRPLPVVSAVLFVRPTGGDDTVLLQSALDRVAARSIGTDGFRGALLLSAGRFHVAGQLHLNATGVVLRGAGAGVNGTTIVADGIDRRTLVEIGASTDPQLDQSIAVAADAPVGSLTLALASVAGLHSGDRILVRRPSTSEWISAISMSGLPGTFANQRLDWRPGSHDLRWDRIVVSIDAAHSTVTLDAPITTALEQKYGGGTVARVSSGAPPAHIGLENLVLESVYDHALPKDEEHAWIAVLLDRVEDAWVRNVTARHFVASAVRVNWRGRRITVEDVRNEAPIAEEGGYRRQSFVVNGQQVLIHRAWSEQGTNDFASGLLAAGPNVFLDCTAERSLGASGSFEGWASGILYERVHVPTKLQLLLDFSRAQGAGWTAANSVVWNSTAQSIEVLGPPEAPNFVITSPNPLYENQLAARIGAKLEPALTFAQENSSAPAEFRSGDIKPAQEKTPEIHPVTIINGRFVVDGKILWGPSQTEAWWRGDTSPLTAMESTGSSVTRFMPGVVAPGLTEDLAQMAARLKARGIVSIQVNPGLWYDHRRDAHTVEHRDDGNVWAPFYEVPWARSGKGIAWDGLSKFDLTRYNPFYFARQLAFARAAAAEGIVVFYDLYNTHNVLEIGPHWIDYAWRPANNINDTGLPEPPPLRVHGRSDEGNEFFSTSYAPLRSLHRAYILHTLDVLAGQPNVIFGLAYQYAGPLEFQQFFQDTVREWEQAHHTRVPLALTTSKQTTDAILADPARAAQIAVVDMRYWVYMSDGTLFAPRAGENHAFRELIARAFPGYTDTPPFTTAQMVYKQVREYRDRFPHIALMPMESGAGPIPILMAGAASQSALVGRAPTRPPTEKELASSMFPARPVSAQVPGPVSNDDKIVANFIAAHLALSLMKMEPKDGWVSAPETTWVLAGKAEEAGSAAEPVLVYSLSGPEITLTKPLLATHYKATWIDPRTGAETAAASTAQRWTKPDPREWLLLLEPAQ